MPTNQWVHGVQGVVYGAPTRLGQRQCGDERLTTQNGILHGRMGVLGCVVSFQHILVSGQSV